MHRRFRTNNQQPVPSVTNNQFQIIESAISLAGAAASVTNNQFPPSHSIIPPSANDTYLPSPITTWSSTSMPMV
jgi:hypothetical protein